MSKKSWPILLYIQEVLIHFTICPRSLDPFNYMSKKSWPILLYVQEVLTYFTLCPRSLDPFYYMFKKSWPILLYVQEVLTHFTICLKSLDPFYYYILKKSTIEKKNRIRILPLIKKTDPGPTFDKKKDPNYICLCSTKIKNKYFLSHKTVMMRQIQFNLIF